MFGTIKAGDTERRIVRVKSTVEQHIQPDTFMVYAVKSEDMTTIYEFTLGECFKRSRDADENRYAWYYVNEYAKSIDRTPGIKIDIDGLTDKMSVLEDATCEIDENANERLASIEDAICELDEIINGGE